MNRLKQEILKDRERYLRRRIEVLKEIVKVWGTNHLTYSKAQEIDKLVREMKPLVSRSPTDLTDLSDTLLKIEEDLHNKFKL